MTSGHTMTIGHDQPESAMRYQDEQFQQRQQRILLSAHALFAAHSWEEVTIAEVAEAAGIGKGTVYKHFPSKEALYAELVLAFSLRCLQGYQQLAASQPADGALLRRVIRQAFSEFNADPVLAQLCLHCDRPDFKERLTDDYRQRLAALEQDFALFFAHLVRQTLRDLPLQEVDCQRLLWAMDACFAGALARIAAGRLGDWFGDTPIEAYLDQVTDFILAGLQGQAHHLLAQRAGARS